MTRRRADQVDRERRLSALKTFVDAFERDHGVITSAEIERQSRRAASCATAARAGEQQPKRRRPRSPP